MDCSNTGFSFLYANRFVYVSGCVVDGSDVEMNCPLLFSAMCMSSFYTADFFSYSLYVKKKYFSETAHDSKPGIDFRVHAGNVGLCYVYPDFFTISFY